MFHVKHFRCNPLNHNVFQRQRPISSPLVTRHNREVVCTKTARFDRLFAQKCRKTRDFDQFCASPFQPKVEILEIRLRSASLRKTKKNNASARITVPDKPCHGAHTQQANSGLCLLGNPQATQMEAQRPAAIGSLLILHATPPTVFS